jgi:hypothetical protein
LEQPWVRALFSEFCTWDGLNWGAGALVARIDRYALVFAQIDRRCNAPSQLDQDCLFALFGAEGLRRAHVVVTFLTVRLSIVWSEQRRRDKVEMRRIQNMLDQWSGEPWSHIIKDFLDAQRCEASKCLRPKTLRVYINAASRLLAYADLDDLVALSQYHVDGFLRSNPGQAASLSPFLRFVLDRAGSHLSTPTKKSRDLARHEKKLVGNLQGLWSRLEKTNRLAEGRALLIEIVAKAYQIPTDRILGLTRNDVTVGRTVTLWPGHSEIELVPRLTPAFLRWAALENHGYIFPGRSQFRPLSYDAVRHHVVKS